jgi:hypothetical protein
VRGPSVWVKRFPFGKPARLCECDNGSLGGEKASAWKTRHQHTDSWRARRGRKPHKVKQNKKFLAYFQLSSGPDTFRFRLPFVLYSLLSNFVLRSVLALFCVNFNLSEARRELGGLIDCEVNSSSIDQARWPWLNHARRKNNFPHRFLSLYHSRGARKFFFSSPLLRFPRLLAPKPSSSFGVGARRASRRVCEASEAECLCGEKSFS